MSKKHNKTAARAKRRNIVVEPLEPRVLFSADVVSASLALDSTLENSEEQHNWQANIYQSGSTVSDSKGDPTQNSTLNNKVTDQAYTVLDDREIGKTRSELIEFEVQASDVINEVNFDREQARQLIVIDGRIDDIEAVISDVLSRGQSDVEFDFILLDSETDGIDAISQALTQKRLNNMMPCTYLLTAPMRSFS